MYQKIRNRLTLKDIANKLQVTPATVSKALRESSDISLEMREKVKSVAKDMGYRPNLLARSLINQKSKLLGILIPDLRISFFSEAVRGAYEEANRKGYETILLIHDENNKIERKKLEFLADIHTDGILLNTTGNKNNFALYQKLAEEGIKIVCWDRKLERSGFHSVTIDDRKASYQLTSKMIKEGRKNILFLGPNTGIPVAKYRFEGYKLALKEHGISFNPKLVVKTFRDYDKSYKKILSVLDSKIKFDGVVSVGGLITYGAGRAILDRKLLIPGDVMLGEFGDNNIVARLGVPFLTVYQHPYTLGKSAVDLLIKIIEDKEKNDKYDSIIIDSEILER